MSTPDEKHQQADAQAWGEIWACRWTAYNAFISSPEIFELTLKKARPRLRSNRITVLIIVLGILIGQLIAARLFWKTSPVELERTNEIDKIQDRVYGDSGIAVHGSSFKEGETMCDYSLAGIPNRLATEGEQLMVYRFPCGFGGTAQASPDVHLEWQQV